MLLFICLFLDRGEEGEVEVVRTWVLRRAEIGWFCFWVMMFALGMGMGMGLGEMHVVWCGVMEFVVWGWVIRT